MMSTPGSLLFLLGCKHDLPHGPGMLTWSSGQSQTGRVKLKKKNPWGLLLSAPLWKNLEAIYCPCCYVNSEEGDGGDQRNKTANSLLSAAGTSVRQDIPSACRVGDGCLSQDKQEFRSDPHPQHFWNWMKVPYLNM